MFDYIDALPLYIYVAKILPSLESHLITRIASFLPCRRHARLTQAFTSYGDYADTPRVFKNSILGSASEEEALTAQSSAPIYKGYKVLSKLPRGTPAESPIDLVGVDIKVRWTDQGWGNKKSALLLVLERNSPEIFAQESTLNMNDCPDALQDHNPAPDAHAPRRLRKKHSPEEEATMKTHPVQFVLPIALCTREPTAVHAHSLSPPGGIQFCGGVRYQQGDKLYLGVYVGGGGGHRIFVSELNATLTFGLGADTPPAHVLDLLEKYRTEDNPDLPDMPEGGVDFELGDPEQHEEREAGGRGQHLHWQTLWMHHDAVQNGGDEDGSDLEVDDNSDYDD